MPTHVSRAVHRASPARSEPPELALSAAERRRDVDPAKLHPDTLLRNEQVAAILGCPDSTFYQLRKRLGRNFPRPVMIGARVRWRWGTVQEWIRRQESGTSTEAAQ